MKNDQELRIAWVMPITCVYWQAILKDFVKFCPKTKIFTSKVFPSPWGWESYLDIEIVGKLKVVQFKTQNISYGSKFALMSPAIVSKLFNYQPQLIFADTFCLWTLLVLLTKFLGKWQVILAYEGSSPGVDYCNSWIRLLVRRFIVKMADACITNTKLGKNYLVQNLYACENKVFVYPYLVPDANVLVQQPDVIKHLPLKTVYNARLKNQLNLIQLPLTNISFSKPVFLFIGRIIARKGIKLLLEACLRLKQQGYENYSLLIIGEGIQKKELEQFCQKHQLDNNVKWIGQVDYQSIGSYFNLVDILILPSLEDTWGMVVLEAILFGKVVLCSNSAGASEIIAEHQNGYVFESQNTDQLAKSMADLITNPNLIKSMQKKSQQIASQYTPELAAKFLTKLTQSIC